MTARRLAAARGRTFRAAKLFWWFNQGAAVDISVTPKPYYGADGNKAFGIAGTPDGLTDRLERKLGPFPFRTFWGPTAGLPCTDWIARCAAEVLTQRAARPDARLPAPPRLRPPAVRPVRLRHAPAGRRARRRRAPRCSTPPKALGPASGSSASTATATSPGPVLINRALRRAGLLERPARPVRRGPRHRSPAGPSPSATISWPTSTSRPGRRSPARPRPARRPSRAWPGVLDGDERGELGLDHPRSGELVALSEPDAWFAYPFWLDDRHAPDYARTVDIHRKPGLRPVRAVLRPGARPGPRAAPCSGWSRRSSASARSSTSIPLDPSLVRGSHGLPAALAAGPADPDRRRPGPRRGRLPGPCATCTACCSARSSRSEPRGRGRSGSVRSP